jgi:hypothetical protein
MTMDLPTALSKLAYNRTHNLRKSQETFDAGVLVSCSRVAQAGRSLSSSSWPPSTLGTSTSQMYVCALEPSPLLSVGANAHCSDA